MAEGLVYLAISAFLLLNQILRIGGEKLDKFQTPIHSIPFEVGGGQNIIDNAVARVLTPPYQSESSKHNSNHRRKDVSGSMKAFFIQKPIPMELIQKTTFTTGPVDEATFRRLERQNLPTYSREDELKRNVISSNEHSFSDRLFQRRTINSSPFQAQENRLRSSGSRFKFQDGLTPVTASIRGFIATPGKRVQKISGTPMQFLEQTLFKNKRIDLSDLQLPLSSSTSMTVIPAVVRSLPIVIQSQNSKFQSGYDSDVAGSSELSSFLPFSNNAITNHISNSIFKRFKRLPPNTFSNNNFRFARNLKSQNSNANSVNMPNPNKLKVIIYSKTPSKEQPPVFWNKIFQMIPQLSKSPRLSPVLSNATPKRSEGANNFVNRFQNELKVPHSIPRTMSPPHKFSTTNQHISIIDGSTTKGESKSSQAGDGSSFSDSSSSATGHSRSSLLTWANFNNKYNVENNN